MNDGIRLQVTRKEKLENRKVLSVNALIVLPIFNASHTINHKPLKTNQKLITDNYTLNQKAASGYPTKPGMT